MGIFRVEIDNAYFQIGKNEGPAVARVVVMSELCRAFQKSF
jgi:hypothetical protein